MHEVQALKIYYSSQLLCIITSDPQNTGSYTREYDWTWQMIDIKYFEEKAKFLRANSVDHGYCSEFDSNSILADQFVCVRIRLDEVVWCGRPGSALGSTETSHYYLVVKWESYILSSITDLGGERIVTSSKETTFFYRMV